MNITVDIEIEKPKEIVWSAITDIENCEKMLSSILDLKILNQPENGLVGLKWEETRLMFGKEATETMWITEAVEHQYYCTRAESHGCIYITKLSLSKSGKNTLLTLSFLGETQALMAKVVSAIISIFVNRTMQRLLLKDLEDIKKFVEQK